MSSANSSSPVREGSIVAEKYVVERVLGTGGMGVVVAARHRLLGERVALKFLRPHALAIPEVVGRFMQEARAATRMKTEHVARVTDVGQLPDGAPYIVMEYLDGYDLSAWVAQHGVMPVALAVDFTLQACEALAEAHWRGIVHRDLKPSNLFCVSKPDGTPCIKVLDFGISKLTGAGEEDHKLTKTTAVLGSPVYMSPEQMRRSKEVDARTDIWSLGITLFELLTGRTPFAAQTVPELVIKVATEPPPLLRTVRADAPAGLEAVLERCLEKDREARFPDVAALAVALQPFGSAVAAASVAVIVGTLARERPSGELPSAASASSPDDRSATWPAVSTELVPRGRAARTRRRVIALAGVALVTLVVGGVARVATRHAPETLSSGGVAPSVPPASPAPPSAATQLPTAVADPPLPSIGATPGVADAAARPLQPPPRPADAPHPGPRPAPPRGRPAPSDPDRLGI